MTTSYNGWYASPNLATRPLVVAGESFVPGILDDDDVYTVLHYVASQMHERVEPIVRDDWHQMDDWGYNYRRTTNDSSLSCHSSGTAIDYNATRHPFNVPASANFSPAQIEEIRAIVREAGVVVWGGEWNTADAMHFEINGTAAEVASAADRIRDRETDDMFSDDDRKTLREANANAAKALAAAERAAKQSSRTRQGTWERDKKIIELARATQDDVDAILAKIDKGTKK